MKSKFTVRNGLDEEGYVIELSKTGHLKRPHKKIIEKILFHLVQVFSDRLHSVYVYGSVARGTAKPYISDIDFTVLLTSPLTKRDKEIFSTLSLQLQRMYPLFRKIDFDPGSLKEALDKTNRYSWGFWLRHCCICVYGDDVGLQFPQLKLTNKIAEGMNGNLDEWIKQYVRLIKKSKSPEETKGYCSAMMRKIIRTGFSMVMVREQCWTGDLNVCSRLFIKYYPEQKLEIKQICLLAKNPIDNKETILKILNSFGKWLVEEFNCHILK